MVQYTWSINSCARLWNRRFFSVEHLLDLLNLMERKPGTFYDWIEDHDSAIEKVLFYFLKYAFTKCYVICWFDENTYKFIK